jgi:hypothetical protein
LCPLGAKAAHSKTFLILSLETRSGKNLLTDLLEIKASLTFIFIASKY